MDPSELSDPWFCVACEKRKKEGRTLPFEFTDVQEEMRHLRISTVELWGRNELWPRDGDVASSSEEELEPEEDVKVLARLENVEVSSSSSESDTDVS